MTTKLVFIFSLITGTATLAQADIQDRINQCESRGGGACIYAILRELANNPNATTAQQPESKCKCSTYEWSPGSNCQIGEHKYSLTRDGRNVGGSKCYRSSDSAYVECIKQSNLDQACR